MTARSQIGSYESKVREYTNFAVRGVKKVCKACGPRQAGSEAERKAQDMMAKEMGDCCDSTQIEEFKFARGAFLGWVRISVVLTLLSVAAYHLGFALFGVIFTALAMLYTLLEFIGYKEFLDFLFPKHRSSNLVCVRKPSGEVRRRLILCGHTDSAPEWRMTYYGYKWFKKPGLLLFVIVGSFITVLFIMTVSLIAVFTGHGWNNLSVGLSPAMTWLGYAMFPLLLPVLCGWFFKNEKRYVEGANDNLSGCFTAMAVPKLMENQNLRFEHTELVVVCSGAEEYGLRGAKAFMKAHAEEYNDVETVFIALDTMTDLDHLGIYIDDLTMTVKHDPAVCAMMRKAANTAGRDVPYAHTIFGASDAAAAAQAGMHSGLLVAMDQAPSDYYHTRLDTCERLQPKTVEACLDIVLETAYQFDETGLAGFEGAKVAVVK